MAVPKRRQSHARTNSRRSQWKLTVVASSACPQCHQPKMPHRVCPNCGFYKGRKVVEVEAAE